MNCINETQIQSTNDASTVSKFSAVTKNYYRDDFIQEFVVKKKSRAPLIHLGYYTRAVILNKLITHFIEFLKCQKDLQFQVISLGAGYDTTYWRLSQMGLLHNSIYIEIDFPNVIQRKLELINHSQKLSYFLQKPNSLKKSSAIKKLNFNYFLLEADLSDIMLIEKHLKDIDINFEVTTLFLSECVITYMKEADSRRLIEWISKKFRNGGFINYEQIHPDDGFGKVMLKHFDKLQSPLFSVPKYVDCKSHYFRFKNHGFESNCCLSEWDALFHLVSKEERQRILSLELFDEFEEFHLKCVHYVVAIGGNGIASNWILTMPLTQVSTDTICRPLLRAFRSECDLELFRHFSCSGNESNYLFGGCTRRNRSSVIYKVTQGDRLSVKAIKNSDQSICLDMVYGSGVHFELNKRTFFCLYGGRTSPDKVWNDGSTVIGELVAEEFFPRLILREGNPTPRYRTAMVCLKDNESEANCWIYGGRTSDLTVSLSDLWKLTITQDQNKNAFTAKWTQQQRNTDCWPCARMSHSFTAFPGRRELYLIGGFNVNSSAVLNDVWKWSCEDDRWEEIQLAGKLLPRYGHTSHSYLKDNVIFLIGGVNTIAGLQPGLARIDLTNLTVTEYDLLSPELEVTLLFNHATQMRQYGDDLEIRIIGGGGNCFSFGTHINQSTLCVRLNQE